MNNLEYRLRVILAQQVGVHEDTINREKRIVEDLGCDSLDTVEILMACEEEFSIAIPDDEGDRVFDDGKATVGSIADYLKGRVAA